MKIYDGIMDGLREALKYATGILPLRTTKMTNSAISPPKLIKVEAFGEMKLKLFYETGEVRIFDVAPYAEGTWCGELRNDDYFRTVRMLPGGIGIEWRDGQDIAPHALYEESTLVS